MHKTSELAILHTNDFHGCLDEPRREKLRALRTQADLYFDCGDAVKAGNLGFSPAPEQVWQLLAELDVTAGVPGNRESHLAEAALRTKLNGLKHPLLCANLRRKDGTRPFPESIVLETPLGKVGVLGVMVPMVTDRMAARHASAFLWDPPIPIACELAERLAPECDHVLALTHIGLNQDRRLASEGAPIDVILGGHSHSVLTEPERVGRTFIAHAGSHARMAGLYRWDGDQLTGSLHPLI
jgi:2',3'-cyclic-nucleotide 2'-phosphodiesterase (5'-nucleotidase family)